MAIATTFTLAFYVHLLVTQIREIRAWLIKKVNEEIDMACEVQHFIIMVQEHLMFLEGGPILVRMIAITLEVFLITEEEE